MFGDLLKGIIGGSSDEAPSQEDDELEMKSGWHRVMRYRDLPSGQSTVVKVANRTVTLFNPGSYLRAPRPVPDHVRALAKKLNPNDNTPPPEETKVWQKPAEPTVYALDEFCYHEGGPLSAGDIEDWNGVACVKCPYHSYAIALTNGERFLQDLGGGFKSLGIRQRAHEVKIKDNGYVYVKILRPEDYEDTDPRHKLECDRFQEGRFAKNAYVLPDHMKGAQLSRTGGAGGSKKKATKKQDDE
jgi:nitrite reductase/ring-hydroxylating ferredoxin subunit